MESDENSVFGDLEDQCTCWVCFELFNEPITLHCGHSFCKECAEKVCKKNASCPFCRKAIELPLPPVNKELEALLATYLKKKQELADKKMEDVNTVSQDALILGLPEEVVLDIFSYLPPKELGKASRVCRDFKRLADDPWVWRDICLSQFPFCSVDKYGKNWKWCYIARSNIHKGWEEGKAGDFEVTTLRGHTNYVNVFRLYRNNIVSGSADSTLKVWKVDSTTPLNTLVGHNGVIKCLQFNEVKIVSGATDQKVKVWDTKTGLPIRTLSHNGAVNCLQFDDNKIISAGTDNQVKVWDVREGSCVRTLNGHYQQITSLEFDNNKIYTNGDDRLSVWDLGSGNLLRNLDDNSGRKTCFQLVGGNQLISGSLDGQLKLWDVNTGVVTDFNGPRHYMSINDLQTDGKTVVTGAQDGSLKVWDLSHRKLLHTLQEHKAPVNALQFNGKKIVSAAGDNTLKVWDAQRGKRLYTLLGGTLQKRANNPEHPTKAGVSHVEIDDSRIIASMASLLRVYDFEVYKPKELMSM